ncbi:MAG TPA: SDR family oxidoreductase [Candidatus Binatia bacterium]|jgi:3-oxoacyl-[acyl-carrier protein] reductase|nr:SDR family oxidoreductase [Candidatus Binatia bacterium]
MDLGIRGRRAIVCAASRGLGKACATALAREGVAVVINARDVDVLAATAAEIRATTGVDVTTVAGDVTTDETRDALLAACPEPDILITNNAGPPPGRFQDWDRGAWTAALDAQMLSPIALIRAVVDGMVDRRFGRIVNITSAMVKAPLAPMGLSAGARAGLTSACKALSQQVAWANVTVNNLLPERIDTDRQAMMARLTAAMNGITEEEAYDQMRARIPAGRLGRPDEFGDACAFLCSDRAGFITGQNLQLDGGAYAGLF